MFTLPDIETDKETKKRMGCTELCGGVHTSQRQIPVHIPIGFCANLLVSVGAGQCEYISKRADFFVPKSATAKFKKLVTMSTLQKETVFFFSVVGRA